MAALFSYQATSFFSSFIWGDTKLRYMPVFAPVLVAIALFLFEIQKGGWKLSLLEYSNRKVESSAEQILQKQSSSSLGFFETSFFFLSFLSKAHPIRLSVMSKSLRARWKHAETIEDRLKCPWANQKVRIRSWRVASLSIEKSIRIKMGIELEKLPCSANVGNWKKKREDFFSPKRNCAYFKTAFLLFLELECNISGEAKKNLIFQQGKRGLFSAVRWTKERLFK